MSLIELEVCWEDSRLDMILVGVGMIGVSWMDVEYVVVVMVS